MRFKLDKDRMPWVGLFIMAVITAVCAIMYTLNKLPLPPPLP